MQTSWLFTEQGALVPLAPHGGRAGGCGRSVKVIERRDRTEVRFARDTVSPVALTALVVWLTTSLDRPLVIVPDGETAAEIVHDRRRAIGLLSDLIDRRANGPRFRKQRIVLEQARLFGHSRIAATVLSASLPRDEEARLLDHLFAGSFNIVRFDAERGACHVDTIGSRIAALDPAFDARRATRRFADLSDKGYGRWLAETFASYVDLKRPIAESIFAEIHWPGVETSVWYERVMVPFERGGDKYVLSGTIREYGLAPEVVRGAQRPAPARDAATLSPVLCAPQR